MLDRVVQNFLQDFSLSKQIKKTGPVSQVSSRNCSAELVGLRESSRRITVLKIFRRLFFGVETKKCKCEKYIIVK